ncbi:low-density lipoprotein receptor-related protein 2-like [Ciona intestinalis]
MWYAAKQGTYLGSRRYNFTPKPKGIGIYDTHAEYLNATLNTTLGSCEGMPKCDHICLPRNNATRECACSLGFHRINDTHCVQKPLIGTDALLMVDYGQGKIFQLPINQSGSYNFSIVDIGTQANGYAMDIDMGTDTLYWFDRKRSTIFKTSLQSTSNSQAIVTNVTASTMAMDQLTGNLYFADSNTDFIKVYNPHKEITLTVMKVPKLRENISDISSMAHDARNGFLYWTDVNGGHGFGQLWRMRNDGSEKRAVLNQLNWPHGVTISYERSSLFYSESWSGRIIEYSMASLESMNPNHRSVYSHLGLSGWNGHYFNSMTVLGDWLYYYDRGLHYIQRYNLRTRRHATRFGPPKFFKGRDMTKYSKDYYNRYISTLRNPCGRNSTNECPEFCFNENNRRVCKCKDGSSFLTPTVCVDNSNHTSNPPVPLRGCPLDTDRRLEPCQNTVSFSWTSIEWVDDNTPTTRLRTTQPSQPSPVNLRNGTHEFVFTATDESNNTGICRFTVNVYIAWCDVSRFDNIAPANLVRTDLNCDGRPYFNVSCRSPHQNVTIAGAYSSPSMMVACMLHMWIPGNLRLIQCLSPPKVVTTSQEFYTPPVSSPTTPSQITIATTNTLDAKETTTMPPCKYFRSGY